MTTTVEPNDPELSWLCGIQAQEIDALKAENSRLRSALEFYASRTVYYRAHQFAGDGELIECSDVAENALKGPQV